MSIDSLHVSQLRTRVGAATDVGLRRATNEDSYLAASPIFLVADGMGGHDAGEVASAIAVETFSQLVGPQSRTPAEVRDALERANHSIASLATAGPRHAGTTISGVVIAESEGLAYWLVFNLGDSRTYLLSNSDLEQISVDHSIVQELVDTGSLDRAAAAVHPDRNVITRALGSGGDFRPDYWLVPVEPGDRVMICSDGVSGEIGDEAIKRILLEESDPQDAATRLVNEGLLHGGRDNLTAVVVDAWDAGGSNHADHALNDTIPRGIGGSLDYSLHDTLPHGLSNFERTAGVPAHGR
jgi:serine/threonine protein phosphatase PrpC